MSVSAILCAAGKGTRAGFEKNKLLAKIDDAPVLQKTLRAFDIDEIDEIVVAYSPTDLSEIQRLVDGIKKVKLVQGGDTRTQTVYNALQAATGEIVLIHDGARPFVSRQVIENCIRCVQEYGSGICAVPCVDTVSVVNSQGEIISTPDRNTVWMAQTPQVFKTKLYRAAAYTALQKGFEGTDDNSLVEFIDYPIRLIECGAQNIKITTREDLCVAEAILRDRKRTEELL